MSVKLTELREPRLDAREPRLEAKEPRLLLEDTVRLLADRLHTERNGHFGLMWLDILLFVLVLLSLPLLIRDAN